MKFNPEQKRRQLERRGWSEKRIDAYMNHCRHFTINHKKAAEAYYNHDTPEKQND